MGIYLNPANNGYSETKNGKVFVDKSLLIDYTNQVIKTPQKNICVSRPRRFGKSTDANMLVAYYSKGCDSLDIFNDLKISQTELYEIAPTVLFRTIGVKLTFSCTKILRFRTIKLMRPLHRMCEYMIFSMQSTH